jgi:hypothetical protein
VYGANQQGGSQQQPSATSSLPPWQGGSDANGGATGNGRPAPSGISLPKGEGAIRGIWWILGYSFGAVTPPEILDVVTLGSTREGWRGKEVVR